jgi:single-strand DNA-binding protein
MSNIASHPSHVHKNEVHLAGVLARDPEVRYTASGKAVASFTVATTYEKHTEYHRCSCWEKQAERLSEQFHKGDFIKLAGRLQTRSWDDKETGKKRYTTEIVVWNFSDGTTEKNTDGAQESAPLTPDATTGGTALARAILSSAQKNVHGLEVSDADIPF